jgi:catechol 2,3-dioxygenase-like lactoylglutathione lyase family enzyme
MITRFHSLLLCAGVAVALFSWLGGQDAAVPSAAPRLFRVIVPVADIERGAEFYTRLLGIQGQRVSGGRHYFDCGGVILALLSPQADGDEGAARPLPDHVYFAVADLEACHARAAELDCLSTEVGDGELAMGEIQVRPWGERSFYLRDPFGTPLCFVDEATLFTGR